MVNSSSGIALPQKIRALLWTIGLISIVSYLFYNSWFGLLAMPICFFLINKRMKKQEAEKQRSLIARQFMDAMQMIGNCLLSGYSMENAWREAEKEFVGLYGENAPMAKELHQMNQSLDLNIPAEQILEDFARRTDIEDIRNFSEVFSYAKKSGGDMVRIIGTTTYHIRAKLEVGRELEIMVASKKLEQNIMNVVPIFIMAYLRFSSPGYLDPLYGNPVGVVFMSTCLGVYAAAFCLSEKIMKIQV